MASTRPSHVCVDGRIQMATTGTLHLLCKALVEASFITVFFKLCVFFTKFMQMQGAMQGIHK